MEKLYYKMGEAAEILGEETSTVRFWANCFSRHIRPERNAKGNRMFTPKDMETLKTIAFLLREQGMTLEGVAKKLNAGSDELGSKMKIVEKLQGIKSMLEELQESL
ncbi:MAG: MerR family transcriptional regulator [Bacteroidales bacterium]|nr:MerR family transcriptional regulator [Candidatus Cacconaster caballi]